MREHAPGVSRLARSVNPAAALAAAAVAGPTGRDDALAALLIDTPEISDVLARSAALIDEVPALAAAHHVIADYQVACSKRFDAFLADAAAAGIGQFVVLGAALDTRAFRLPWPDGAVLYEVDRPDVLRYKVTTLTAHGARTRVDRRPAVVHRGVSWPRALWNAGFDPGRPTAWLAESLLPLPDSAQDAIVSAIDDLSASGSRLAFDDALGRCAGRSDAADRLTAHGWSTEVTEARSLPELSGHRDELPSAHAILVTAHKVA